MEKANLLKTVTVTVVVCDRCRYGGHLVSQFGLSLLADCSWEDGRGRRILFDTGSDGQVLLRNLDELGVPVDSIDLVVLSHAHYDHTGGLEGLVRAEGARFQLVAHSEITRRVFSHSFGLRFIGVDVQILSEIPPHRLLLIEEAARIFPDVWTTGTIPRWCEFEQPGEDVHVLTDEGALIPDREMDDMALLFRVGGDRLVILTGCSHAGIINTVERAVEVGGCDRIDGLIGGFHLLPREVRIQERTVEALSQYDIGSVCSGHCTGQRAEAMLQAALGEAFSGIHTGDRFGFAAD